LCQIGLRVPVRFAFAALPAPSKPLILVPGEGFEPPGLRFAKPL
jgi:hypothetical protein